MVWFAVRFQGFLKEEDNLRLARTSRGFAQLDARFGSNLNYEHDTGLGSDESDSNSNASSDDANARLIWTTIYGGHSESASAPSASEDGGR